MKFIQFHLWLLAMFTMMIGPDDEAVVEDEPTDDDTDSKDDAPTSMLDAVAAGIEEMKGDTDAKDAAKPKDDAAVKADAPAADKPAGDDGKAIDDAAAKPAPSKDALSDEDLEMPEGLSKRAQERFQKLATSYKESSQNIESLTTELETLRAEHETVAAANNEFVTVMESVGAGPESLNTYIDYMAHMKSGDYDKAASLLQAELDNIASMTGKELPGVDLLKAYPDLKDDVDNYKLTRERAVEIAASRNKQAQSQQINDAKTKQSQTQQQAQQQTQQQQNQALTEIDKEFKRLAHTDVDFKRKEAIIMAKEPGKRSMLEEVIQEFPPNLWVKQLTLLYRGIQSGRVDKPGNKQTPLRPSGGGGEAEPGSMLEAMERGLNY